MLRICIPNHIPVTKNVPTVKQIISLPNFINTWIPKTSTSTKAQSFFDDTDQFILDQRQIVILFNYELCGLSDLNAAPFVNSKPHRPFKHVNLCITKNNSGAWFHKVNCKKMKLYFSGKEGGTISIQYTQRKLEKATTIFGQ